MLSQLIQSLQQNGLIAIGAGVSYAVLGAILWFVIPSTMFNVMKKRIQPGAEVGFGMGLLGCCGGGLITGAVAGFIVGLGGYPAQSPMQYLGALIFLIVSAALLGWWAIAPSIMKDGRTRPDDQL